MEQTRPEDPGEEGNDGKIKNLILGHAGAVAFIQHNERGTDKAECDAHTVKMNTLSKNVEGDRIHPAEISIIFR